MTRNLHLLQALLLILTISYTYQAADTITCPLPGPMRTYPSSTSGIIKYVDYDTSFSCNCYIRGKVAGINVKWFRVNLDKGAYGYISNIYCWGDVELCRYALV
ncbi:unnamed protein product [Rotaria magnacalcarata]|uniref:Uncharacterized protein n=1 Tax=Rotaria magnacalcarata TaxID=392030 RepID=A0A816SQP6_9BILA|nr:unnamed protein product [Rotaria magnacalcarata]